jgi:hypothetical protein
LPRESLEYLVTLTDKLPLQYTTYLGRRVGTWRNLVEILCIFDCDESKFCVYQYREFSIFMQAIPLFNRFILCIPGYAFVHAFVHACALYIYLVLMLFEPRILRPRWRKCGRMNERTVGCDSLKEHMNEFSNSL